MKLRWDFGLGRELGLVFWALASFEAAYGVYITIWPLWIEHLGASIATVGIMLSLGGFIRPFVMLGGTWLSDRVNTRLMLVVARSMLVSGLAFAAFAQSWEYLLITILGYSFGELVFPHLHAHIPVHAGNDSARAFALTCTIGPSIALIITPMIASAVIDAFGMRGGLLMSASLSAIGTTFMFFMDFSKDKDFGRDDEPGSVMDVFRHVDTRDVLLTHALTVFALGVGAMLLPNFLKDVRDLSPSLITLLSAGSAIGTLAFGIAGIKIARFRQSPYWAAAWSASVTAASYALFAISPWLPAIAIAFLLRGSGFASWNFLVGAVGQYAPRRLQTRAFAILEILGGGAYSFSPLLAAGLFDRSPTLPLVFGSMASLAMAAVILWRFKRGFGQNVPPATR